MKLSYTVVLLAVAISFESRAQFRDDAVPQDLSSVRNALKTQQGRIPSLPASVPLDAPVNSAEYHVGPGDLFAVSIWAAIPVEYQLTVTPEGSLLIPNVGMLDVRGLTLEEVQQQV